MKSSVAERVFKEDARVERSMVRSSFWRGGEREVNLRIRVYRFWWRRRWGQVWVCA